MFLKFAVLIYNINMDVDAMSEYFNSLKSLENIVIITSIIIIR